ncbi:hypothetical protein F4781DRAFT_420412 [Annulohypoxylon bovei var. microspora]|nr:hypothetical protein F4781DRAFT_420412 [Annulohypoxylon bovei var. microspora]
MTSKSLYKRSAICRSFHRVIFLPTLTTSTLYRINSSDRRDQLHHIACPGLSALQNRHIPCNFNSRQNFTTTKTLAMASDGDYMAFLDKANEDPSKGYAKPRSSSKQDFKATDDGARIPAAIQEATKDSFYVSDADEPFVPVYLAWDESGKGLPDEEEFATLIHHPEPASAQIEIQDPADWDTQGQYKAILDAVRKAGKGNDVRVYRVSKGGVKVEYWVVTTEGKGAAAKLVGAKALAIES